MPDIRAIERKYEDFKFEVPWGHIAGKWYGDRNQQPILAMHDWLDNAGSFDRLVPFLPIDIPVLCIDLPGHGKSSHYPVGMPYFCHWDNMVLVRRMANYFGWTKLRILGHSLGGAIAFLYAACFPDDVSQFISIDSYGPTKSDPKFLVDQAAFYLDKLLEEENASSQTSCFTREQIIAEKIKSCNGSINAKEAEILLVRGLDPVRDSNDKFCFSSDCRIQKHAIYGFLSIDMVLAYAKLVKCHVLHIKTNPGMEHDSQDIYSKVINATRTNATVEFNEVSGSHHVHLSAPERIAPIINAFLQNSI